MPKKGSVESVLRKISVEHNFFILKPGEVLIDFFYKRILKILRSKEIRIVPNLNKNGEELIAALGYDTKMKKEVIALNLKLMKEISPACFEDEVVLSLIHECAHKIVENLNKTSSDRPIIELEQILWAGFSKKRRDRIKKHVLPRLWP